MFEDVSSPKLNTLFSFVSMLVSSWLILPATLKICFQWLFFPSQILNCGTTSLRTTQMFKTLRNCPPRSSLLLPYPPHPFMPPSWHRVVSLGHSKSMAHTKNTSSLEGGIGLTFFFKLNQTLSVSPLVTFYTRKFLFMSFRGWGIHLWSFFPTLSLQH